MPRKKAVLKYGVMGLAEMDARAITATLTDFWAAANTEATWVLPVTKALFSESVKAVADFLIEEGIAYEVVTDEASAKARALKPYLTNAAETHVTGIDAGTKLVRTLNEADEAKFLVFAQDDDLELEVATTAAFDFGIPVIGVNFAMQELVKDDEEEVPEAEPEAPAEAPKVIEAKPRQAKKRATASGPGEESATVEPQAEVDPLKAVRLVLEALRDGIENALEALS